MFCLNRLTPLSQMSKPSKGACTFAYQKRTTTEDRASYVFVAFSVRPHSPAREVGKPLITRRLKYAQFCSHPRSTPGPGNYLRTLAVLNIEEPPRKEVMQAHMITETIGSERPRVVRPSVENRRFQKRNSQAVQEDSSKRRTASLQPIENEESCATEAIRRARDGDATAFQYLYRLHSRRVYAVCLRMAGDTTEAEDLTQEAFLLLFRKIHTFRGESAFSTWLHRLVVNIVLMHFRKKSLPAVSMDSALDPDGEIGSSRFDIAAPDLLLEGSIDRINLERCIAQLP